MLHVTNARKRVNGARLGKVADWLSFEADDPPSARKYVSIVKRESKEFIRELSCICFKFVNGILRNWESLCDIRQDCHHHFDASGTQC